jgi:hypothetical protein
MHHLLQLAEGCLYLAMVQLQLEIIHHRKGKENMGLIYRTRKISHKLELEVTVLGLAFVALQFVSVAVRLLVFSSCFWYC